MASPVFPISVLNAFAMPSHLNSLLHSPTPSNPPIYLPLKKSNGSMISKEIIRLSNRVSDLPEEIRLSRKNKPTIEL